MNEERRIYRINHAKDTLGVSRATIYRLIKTGHLQLVKLTPRTSGVTAESLDRLVESRIVSHHISMTHH